jgi:hypothetical protein
MTGCRGRAYELRAGHCPHRASCSHYRDDESAEPHRTILTCGRIEGTQVRYPNFEAPAPVVVAVPVDGEGSDLD